VVFGTGESHANAECFVEAPDLVKRLSSHREVGAMAELGGVGSECEHPRFFAAADRDHWTFRPIGIDLSGDEANTGMQAEDCFEGFRPSGLRAAVVIREGDQRSSARIDAPVAGARKPRPFAPDDGDIVEPRRDASDRRIGRRRIDEDGLLSDALGALDGGERVLQERGAIARADHDGKFRRRGQGAECKSSAIGSPFFLQVHICDSSLESALIISGGRNRRMAWRRFRRFPTPREE
jgi:hypothetical protein